MGTSDEPGQLREPAGGSNIEALKSESSRLKLYLIVPML